MLRCAALIVAVAAMPQFDINLDLPPKQRWKNVTHYYQQEMIAMLETWEPMLKSMYEPEEKAEWLELAVPKSEEYLQEMQGIYEELGSNHSFDVDTMHLFNLLYEMGSPTLTACSGLLVADVNGKVIHGRNMDYAFQFKMPDGSLKDWPDVTFEANFWKNGKKIFLTIQWPMYLGAHTGMRFNGWTFEQNTRLGMNDPQLNLAAAKAGGVAYGFPVRKLLESVPDFETALQKLNATSFMAPQYFVMSGAKPYEGAIVSMDRLHAQSLSATPPVRRFSESSWYLLETNDDVNKLPQDPRRPIAESILAMHSQEDASINFVWDVIHHWPLKNHLSVFTWVAQPSTNYSQGVLRGEDPILEPENIVSLFRIYRETDQVQLLERFLRRHEGRKHVTSPSGLHRVS